MPKMFPQLSLIEWLHRRDVNELINCLEDLKRDLLRRVILRYENNDLREATINDGEMIHNFSIKL